jgi:hypothetical protein
MEERAGGKGCSSSHYIFTHYIHKFWTDEKCVKALITAVQRRHEMLGSLLVLVAIILVVNSNLKQ